MPVDDTKLEKIVEDVGNKINAIQKSVGDLRELHATASSIVQLNIPDPTPDDVSRTKKGMPNDRSLGSKITTARRQEIYDKVVAQSVTLLA